VKRAVRAYGRYVAWIVIFALASLIAAGYILVHQRLQLPFADTYTVRAEFPNSTGLVPGLGEPANVAGVKVGQINGVTLQDGRSIVSMTIDKHKLGRVYSNATAVLYPNTPLDDMQIDITPGGPPGHVLHSGELIPVAQTTAPLQSDDFLDALDSDSRQYFTTLAQAAGAGLDGQGPNLRALLETLGPTSEQVHTLAHALDERRVALSQLVHNLAVLAVAAGERDNQIGQVVVAGDQTLRALASQDTALKSSIAQLPGTLSAAQRTLTDATPLAQELGPTLNALEPGVQAAPAALSATGKLLKVATPAIQKTVRPLVQTAKPIVSELIPIGTHLIAMTPDLSSSFQVLNYTVNEAGYNQGGNVQSYLFWIAWFAHNVDSVASVADANGHELHGELLVSCSELAAQPALGAILDPILGSTVCSG
jgi:phospholipid/cholesterol/gamma-HCH transport system substrate-binding protein